MYVIANIHDNVNKPKTYLGRRQNTFTGKYEFGPFRNAMFFEDLSTLKESWNKIYERFVEIDWKTDNVIIEYVHTTMLSDPEDTLPVKE